MKKWGYKIVNNWPKGNLCDSELNTLGDEWWELISIDYSKYNYEYYFKREKVWKQSAQQ